MSINIAGYNFKCPIEEHDLENKLGVYVVLDSLYGLGTDVKDDRGFGWNIVDVGMSGEIRSRIENHDRKDCWEKHKSKKVPLEYAMFYDANEDTCKKIEKKIRDKYNPPCGER